MQEIVFIKYRKLVYGLAMILSLNFAFSIYALWIKFIDLEMWSYLRLVFMDFEIDQAIIMADIESVYEIMPLAQTVFVVLSFFVCLVAIKWLRGQIRQFKYLTN